MKIVICLSCLVSLLAVACAQPPDAPPSEAKQLDKELALIENNGVGRVAIVHVPTDFLTNVGFTPQTLESGYQAKLTIRDLRLSPYRRELADALRNTRMTPAQDIPDLRWAVLLFDLKDQRVGALYLSGDGRGGALDDAPVKFSGPLFGWLRRSFGSTLK